MAAASVAAGNRQLGWLREDVCPAFAGAWDIQDKEIALKLVAMTRRWMMVRLIAIFCCALVISGCATTAQVQRPAGPPPASTRPVYNLTGYSPAFKDGYIDGCETSKKTRYGVKDERRFSADAQYRMGWNDGFSVCRGKR